MMKNIFTFSIITLISLVLTACSVFGKSKPEDVAIKFVKCSYNADYDCVIKTFDVPKSAEDDGTLALVSGKIKSAIEKAKTKADRKGGIKEVVVDSKQIDEPNGTGHVKLTVHFKNEGSQSQTEDVPVIRTKDGWKVKF